MSESVALIKVIKSIYFTVTVNKLLPLINPSLLKWSHHIFMGIIFPTKGSCNTVLGSKGKRSSFKKDFISRKKKKAGDESHPALL